MIEQIISMVFFIPLRRYVMNFFDDEPSVFHSSLECSKSFRIIQDNSHLHNISAFAFVASIVLGLSYNNII